MDIFERSLGLRGVKHADFVWACGSVRGLQTVQPFKRQALVVELPAAQAIAAPDKVGDAAGCPAGLEPVWVGASATVRVALQLLMAWQAGAASPFARYIAALPAPGALGTPLHWPQEALDTFPYRPLAASVAQQRARLTDLHGRVAASATPLRGVSYERMCWAIEVVGSRAFKGLGSSTSAAPFALYAAASALLIAGAAALSTRNGVPDAVPIAMGVVGALLPLPSVLQSTSATTCALLPAIDSCNHRGTGALCDVALDPLKNAFVMSANADVAVGQEVTISYGDKHNDDLLQYFGFVEVDCAFDQYVVTDPTAALEEALLAGAAAGAGRDVDAAGVVEELRRRTAAARRGADAPALVVTRADGASAAGLGALAGILRDGVVDGPARAGLRCLLQAEKARLEAAVAAGCLSNLPTDTDRAVATTFLQEKARVLDAAIQKI